MFCLIYSTTMKDMKNFKGSLINKNFMNFMLFMVNH